MQLATAPPYSVADIQPKLTCAHALLRYLDFPPAPEHMYLFSRRLDANSRDFPLLHAAFHRLGGGSLSDMSAAQRLELELKLKEDMTPLIVSAGKSAGEDKFFHAERLPTEPSECLFRLDEMILMKKHQMEQLSEDIASLKGATVLMKTVLNNKASADVFDRMMSISPVTTTRTASKKRPRDDV